MKLIGTPSNPYVRKVRVVLAEKKIDYDFVIDSPSAPNNAASRFNPTGRIPVLVLDDETPVFNSSVIVDYLDNVAPNSKLMPQPNRERMEAKRWEALGDGLLDAAAVIEDEVQRVKKERSLAVIEGKRLVIERCMECMSVELGENTWCMGTHFSLADISVGCALGHLDANFADFDWRSAYPNLAKLNEKLLQRSSFADTVPPAPLRRATRTRAAAETPN